MKERSRNTEAILGSNPKTRHTHMVLDILVGGEQRIRWVNKILRFRRGERQQKKRSFWSSPSHVDICTMLLGCASQLSIYDLYSLCSCRPIVMLTMSIWVCLEMVEPPTQIQVSLQSSVNRTVLKSNRGTDISLHIRLCFFEGSVAEPRRTFVTDLVTNLCNKTRWLVTRPRCTPSDEQTRPVTALFEQTGPVTALFCRSLAFVE